MKLVRIGNPGQERPAVLASPDTAVDVSSITPDFTPDQLADGIVERIRTALKNDRDLPRIALDGVRLGPPLAHPGKIICVGLNYRAHAAEANQPLPDEPILFLKAPYTVVGPYDTVTIPPGSRKTDYEVELAVVIGTRCQYLSSPSDARAYVAGYTISNDISEREYQLERGGQWDKGKNCETFNPLGPWLVTADEVLDPGQLRLGLDVNGEGRQASTTADMIFDVDHLVWYVSQFMTLLPGDIINTGTPQGVGAGFDPPRFLTAGDVVEAHIESLGRQRQVFRDFEMGL